MYYKVLSIFVSQDKPLTQSHNATSIFIHVHLFNDTINSSVYCLSTWISFACTYSKLKYNQNLCGVLWLLAIELPLFSKVMQTRYHLKERNEQNLILVRD